MASSAALFQSGYEIGTRGDSDARRKTYGGDAAMKIRRLGKAFIGCLLSTDQVARLYALAAFCVKIIRLTVSHGERAPVTASATIFWIWAAEIPDRDRRDFLWSV